MAADALDALLERIKRLEAAQERTRTMIVDSVQEGGQVNLREAAEIVGDDTDDESGGIIPGVPSLMSADVQEGQVVLVRESRGQHVVVGATGDYDLSAYAAADHTHIEPVSAITVSDGAAPSGERWKEVAATWERKGAGGSTELWLQRVTAGSGGDPAVTSGTLIKSTSNTASWRPDVGWDGGPPIQGKYRYSDYGNHTGLWFFDPGTWSALSGKTITGVRISVARSAREHGHTYGGVPVHLWTHNHTNEPGGGPTLANGPVAPVVLALGVRKRQVTVPNAFGEYLRDNPGGGIACRGPESDHLIYKPSITVEVDWED